MNIIIYFFKLNNYGFTRNQKKQQEINMANEAAQTLVEISRKPVYVRQRRNKNAVEEDVEKAREELHQLNVIKLYKSVQESLKKTILEADKLLNELDIEITYLIYKLN